MQPRFDLHLRKRGRWPWVAVGTSVLAHSLLLFGWITGRLPDVPRLPRQLIVLAPPAGGPDQAIVTYQLPRPVGERGSNRLPQRRRGTSSRQPPRAELPRAAEAVTVLPRPEPSPAREMPSAGEEASARAPRIGPGLAEGRLWVRPLPLPPRDLAERLSQSRAELADSVVSVIVQAYLDSIAREPGESLEPPSWTTEIAGKKFGLDSKNIYVAGIKIPTVVLRFLSIPLEGGNIDQNRAYSHLMDLRSDLLTAARRAETLEEFKQVIREMRLRKEREREFEKNQRTAPPPETPATP